MFKWTAHPLRERPARAVLAVSVVLVCGLMVATSFKIPLTGMLAGGAAMVVLLLSLNRFFLPSNFAIDDDGITASWPFSKRSIRWSDLRRFAHDAEGGFLSTKSKPSRWDSILRANGMHVCFGIRGEAVAEHIRLHMPMLDEAAA